MSMEFFFLIVACAVAAQAIYNGIKHRRAEAKLTRALATVNGEVSAFVLMGVDLRSGIAINRNATAVCLAGGNWINPEVFEPRDVLSAEVYIDGECETKTSRTSQVGGALVGGILLGGVGMILGGLSGKKRSERKVSSIELRVTVNDTNNPLHDVRLLDKELSRNSAQAKRIIERARTVHAQIAVMIKRADSADREVERQEMLALQSPKTQVPTLSIADELRKLLDLKLSGDLSEAEYAALRERLLA